MNAVVTGSASREVLCRRGHAFDRDELKQPASTWLEGTAEFVRFSEALAHQPVPATSSVDKETMAHAKIVLKPPLLANLGELRDSCATH